MTLAAALLGASLLAVACAPSSQPPSIAVRTGGPLVTEVVASSFDSGRMPSAAIAEDGTPAVSYLLLEPALKPGELPPAPAVNTAQPPAVVVATFSASQGFWSRTSASPQDYVKLKGLQSSIANSKGEFLPGVNTGIAVDADGFHHVIWSTPDAGLLYADDTQGNPPAYGTPSPITKDAVAGAAIAVAADGGLWVSYYDGTSVNVASSADGKSWSVQQVASVQNCSSCPPVRTAIAAGSSGPIVAFTDGNDAKVAAVAAAPTGFGPNATVTDVGAGTGGFGISLAVDKNGTAYVAYYGADGSVSLASGSPGSSFTASKIGGSAFPSGVDTSSFTTGVGVDGNGKVYVTWADPATRQVEFASGQPDALSTVIVPESLSGANPTLAVAPDGSAMVLPFYDSVNRHLNVAVPASGAGALAVASPTPSPPPVAGQVACLPQAGATTVDITAQNTAFDKTCLAMTPDTAFTVDFTNNDAGVQHNVAIYSNAAATKLLGGATSATDVITGPNSTTYSIDPLPTGTYFFRCDVHPTQMTGTFVVAPAGGPQAGPSSSP